MMRAWMFCFIPLSAFISISRILAKRERDDVGIMNDSRTVKGY